MLFRKLQSPRTAVRVGMLLVCAGLLLNVTSQGLVQHLYGSTHLSNDSVDFIRGFCIGLGITMEIAGIVVMLTGRRGRGASLPPQA